MIEVIMPRLSDSMEEGTILKWLVADGAPVRRGDELAEVETDKATMTYEADAEGVLRQVAGEGETLPVGAVIAQLLADGEAPAAAGAPSPLGADANGVDAPGADAPAESGHAPTDGGGRVKASPLARRIAGELGVDLHGVHGTGPGGRVVRADVEQAAEAPAPAPVPASAAPAVEPAPASEAPAAPAEPEPAAPEPAPAAPEPALAAPVDAGAKGSVTVVELSRTQRTIARRMAESKATIPDFQVSTEVDVTELLALRGTLKDAGRVASVNDFIVRAAALAVREHPRANGAYADGQFHLYSRVNVGVAVAGEDTLVVPTVFDADVKAVTAIAEDVRSLAAKVRAGTITPPELSGGTFTVSNLGMFGVTQFTAVVNPGQAAILAVGAAVERLALRDGEPVVRNLLTLTLICDHRILYGADGAALLARVRELLEQPLSLIA